MAVFPKELAVTDERNSRADGAAVAIPVPSAHMNDLARTPAPSRIHVVGGR
jgi:hypothetical protein